MSYSSKYATIEVTMTIYTISMQQQKSHTVYVCVCARKYCSVNVMLNRQMQKITLEKQNVNGDDWDED